MTAPDEFGPRPAASCQLPRIVVRQEPRLVLDQGVELPVGATLQVDQLHDRDVALLIGDGEQEVDDTDEPAVHQFLECRAHLARELVARELDHQQLDRSDRHHRPPSMCHWSTGSGVRSGTLSPWQEVAIICIG